MTISAQDVKPEIDEIKVEMGESFDASKMRIISLQILVVLLEYMNTISTEKVT